MHQVSLRRRIRLLVGDCSPGPIFLPENSRKSCVHLSLDAVRTDVDVVIKSGHDGDVAIHPSFHLSELDGEHSGLMYAQIHHHLWLGGDIPRRIDRRVVFGCRSI
jgi:hypothetical protein